MTELIMLGTGNALVTRCYNTCFAIRKDEEYFLVDAGGGNGILVQLEKAEIPFEKIKAMYISHAHTDHVLGTIWVIRMIASRIKNGTYPGTFHIYCHRELVKIVKEFSFMLLPKKLTGYFDEKILFHKLNDGDRFERMGIRFQAFDIGSKKICQFGFRAVFPDGQSLAFLGDEPFHEQNREMVYGCDWLMSEAFCLYEEREIFKPYEKHHSTAEEAGRTADELDAKHLILYHTEDSDLSRRKLRYRQEASVHYHRPIYVPDDLERIPLTKEIL